MTTAVVGIVDNLVNVNKKHPSQPNAVVDILEAFETQITKSTEQGRNISVVEPNIVLKTTTIKPNTQRKASLTFAVLVTSNEDNRFTEGDLQQVDTQNTREHERKTRTSISFPASLFNVANKNGIDRSFQLQAVGHLFDFFL